MGLFGKSKKEREKEYMNKLDVPSCLKENFELIIDDAFTIMGVGTVATGNILIGMCREGENACIYKANGDILEQKIGICKGDIQHEESLLSGFASFNNSVRIITLGSSLYFCNISNRKSKRNILIL